MRSVAFFGEDQGHEAFLTPLVARFAREHEIEISIRTYSSEGGITKVHYEFGDFLQSVSRGTIETPDLIVLATDSNCMGYLGRRKQMQEVTSKHPALEALVSYAVPDPHIERWMLADPSAFRAVLGRGCTLPKLKCEKDEYKRLLDKEIRASGRRPLIGGFEYAEDLINHMNFPAVEKDEPSFEKTLKDLRGRFQQWKQSLAHENE